MKELVVYVLIIASLIQCSKDKIEVSDIYFTDSMGFPMGGARNDSQWKNMPFTNSELSLFNDLDTANLVGTMLPELQTSSYGFPNPFNHQISVAAT